MAFGQYGYQNPYYPQPVPDNLAQYRMMQQPAPPQPAQAPAQQTGSGVLWVQGEEGAKAYLVAPGNSVLLMDSEGSRFYIKCTDQSGMPQPLRIFDYTERTTASQSVPAAPQTQAADYVTRQEFEALAAQVGEMKGKAKKVVKEGADDGK